MEYQGYPERDLVTNRSSLLLMGGTEAERRAWAEEAALHRSAEGPLIVAATDAEFLEALKRPNGVVFVPDVGRSSSIAQGELVRVLRERDEKPKVVVGLQGSLNSARDQGRIRTDLLYSLQRAQVNLDDADLKEAIRVRRAKAAKAPPPKPPAAPRPAIAPARTTVTPAKTPPAPARSTVSASSSALASSTRGKPTAAAKSAARRNAKPARKASAPARATAAPKKKARPAPAKAAKPKAKTRPGATKKHRR